MKRSWKELLGHLIPVHAIPICAVFVVLLVLSIALPLPAYAQDPAAPAVAAEENDERTSAPPWLEPRGLSVLDLVGQVPEEHLRGSILVFDEAGVTQYLRGERDGDRVTIEVSMPSYYVRHESGAQGTEFPCLGRRPILDEWPVPVPPSEMRIFSHGQEITALVGAKYWLHPAAQAEPIRGSDGDGRLERYLEYGYEGTPHADVARTPSGALAVPANMGCTYTLPGFHDNLTATFVFNYPQQINVEVLGSQTFSFHSYIGVGDTGRLSSLTKQMAGRYGGRHDKFRLNIPVGADYVWLNYPPSPVSTYAANNLSLEQNIRLPSSGTYRLIGFGDTKSVDHVVSMGLPLDAQWTDADLDGGSWLRRILPTELLAAPEYFVPPGVPYDPCMKDGGCPDALLDQIYYTSAEMTIYYYRVRRVENSNLFKVPLRQVGPSWRPGAAAVAASSPATQPVDTVANTLAVEGRASQVTQQPSTMALPRLHLPALVVSSPPPTFPDEEPQDGCPCGWFDQYFRMLDVVPGK